MQSKLLYYLSPIGKLIAFMLFIVIALTPVALLMQVDVVGKLIAQLQPAYQLVLQEGIFFVVILIALLMVFRVFPQYNWTQIFWRPDAWQSGFVKGSLIGLAIMMFCALVLFTLGSVIFEFIGIIWSNIISFFFLFLVVAMFEEFIFRSFTLIAFAERYPFIFTIIINGLLFAAAHLVNPNFGPLAFVNITLAGCLFSIFTLQKWNISWAIGIHFGWNFTQGALLGYNVSGLTSRGIFTAKPVGASYLSGGSFGVEGSVVCTVVLLVLIISLFIKYQIHPLAIVEENEVEIEDELS